MLEKNQPKAPIHLNFDQESSNGENIVSLTINSIKGILTRDEQSIAELALGQVSCSINQCSELIEVNGSLRSFKLSDIRNHEETLNIFHLENLTDDCAHFSLQNKKIRFQVGSPIFFMHVPFIKEMVSFFDFSNLQSTALIRSVPNSFYFGGFALKFTRGNEEIKSDFHLHYMLFKSGGIELIKFGNERHQNNSLVWKLESKENNYTFKVTPSKLYCYLEFKAITKILTFLKLKHIKSLMSQSTASEQLFVPQSNIIRHKIIGLFDIGAWLRKIMKRKDFSVDFVNTFDIKIAIPVKEGCSNVLCLSMETSLSARNNNFTISCISFSAQFYQSFRPHSFKGLGKFVPCIDKLQFLFLYKDEGEVSFTINKLCIKLSIPDIVSFACIASNFQQMLFSSYYSQSDPIDSLLDQLKYDDITLNNSKTKRRNKTKHFNTPIH